MTERKIRWKGRFPELQRYYCGGYVYYLGDSGDIRDEGMWCITREPEGGYVHRKYKTFKAMQEFPMPSWKAGEDDTEEQCLEHIKYASMGQPGTTRTFTKDGHRYAADLEAKEIWEYYERERISPLFVHEQEARNWADENLPREHNSITDQMSIEDFIP